MLSTALIKYALSPAFIVNLRSLLLSRRARSSNEHDAEYPHQELPWLIVLKKKSITVIRNWVRELTRRYRPHGFFAWASFRSSNRFALFFLSLQVCSCLLACPSCRYAVGCPCVLAASEAARLGRHDADCAPIGQHSC